MRWPPTGTRRKRTANRGGDALDSRPEGLQPRIMAEQTEPRVKRVEFKVRGARPVPMTREAKEILVKGLRAAGSPVEVRVVPAGSLYRTLPNVLLVTLTDESKPAKKPRAPTAG